MAESRKIIDVIIFAVSLLVLIFLFFITIYTIQVINTYPLEKSHIQKIHLEYPDATTALPVYVNANNSVEILSLFSVDIFLTYDEPLIEGTNVSIKSYGYLYPRGQRTIGNMIDTNTNTTYSQHVIAVFEGASGIDDPNQIYKNPNGQFAVFLERTSHLQVVKDEYYDDLPILANISWDTQGDFSPHILFPDAISESMIPISFNKEIHVSGSDVLRQEMYSKALTLLTLILVILSYIPVIGFLWKAGNKIF